MHADVARDLATAVMTIEQVPNIPMFRKNTNSGALDRDKQLQVVSQLTEIIAQAAGDPTLAERTWVLLTEAPEGGWGLWGHAHTNAELIGAARAQIAELSARSATAGEAATH